MINRLLRPVILILPVVEIMLLLTFLLLVEISSALPWEQGLYLSLLMVLAYMRGAWLFACLLIVMPLIALLPWIHTEIPAPLLRFGQVVFVLIVLVMISALAFQWHILLHRGIVTESDRTHYLHVWKRGHVISSLLSESALSRYRREDDSLVLAYTGAGFTFLALVPWIFLTLRTAFRKYLPFNNANNETSAVLTDSLWKQLVIAGAFAGILGCAYSATRVAHAFLYASVSPAALGDVGRYTFGAVSLLLLLGAFAIAGWLQHRPVAAPESNNIEGATHV